MIASEYGYTIEQFLDLTMRQLSGFLRAIRIRNTTKEYYQMSFHAKLKGVEMTPLEDILGVTSEVKAFSKEDESAMDELARRMLEERRAMRNV